MSEWQHIYPVDDIKEHITNMDTITRLSIDGGEYSEARHVCPCNPRIDYDYKLFIHNAWDMREAQEFVDKN